jgi:hypothetical protein
MSSMKIAVPKTFFSGLAIWILLDVQLISADNDFLGASSIEADRVLLPIIHDIFGLTGYASIP